jgi:hypothetical protein
MIFSMPQNCSVLFVNQTVIMYNIMNYVKKEKLDPERKELQEEKQ